MIEALDECTGCLVYRRADEANRGAQVVATGAAEATGGAGHARLEGDAVSDFEVSGRGRVAEREHLARALVESSTPLDSLCVFAFQQGAILLTLLLALAASLASATGDPELEARFQESLTLGASMGGSRPGTAGSGAGTAGSRPGTASSRPIWLE